MNFGQNFYNWFSSNAQPVVIVGIIIVGLVLLFQRKVVELLAFVVVAVIAVGLVFNPTGAKDAMLNVFNTVIGNGYLLSAAAGPVLLL